MSLSLTPSGRDLLNQALAGTADINFTRIQFGSGTDAGSSASALTEPKMTLPIQRITPGDRFVSLLCAYHTVANHRSQHVIGEYNVADDSTAAATARGNYVEIVGNGTADNARSNARTLDWSGNEVLAGKLTLGAGPTGSMDAATKGYVDTAVAQSTGAVTAGSIALSAAWSGSGPYTQSVTVTGATVTAASKVDLQLTAAQIAALLTAGVTALVVENNAGTLTAYALGAALPAAMTVQCTVTEVTV